MIIRMGAQQNETFKEWYEMQSRDTIPLTTNDSKTIIPFYKVIRYIIFTFISNELSTSIQPTASHCTNIVATFYWEIIFIFKRVMLHILTITIREIIHTDIRYL